MNQETIQKVNEVSLDEKPTTSETTGTEEVKLSEPTSSEEVK